ncbi:cobalamin biosynthesis protein CobD [Paenibacillus sp. J2TS4]|nr:cobalamin biosynthesis protein CobD [Paenibacillus sp. J2TS4]
MFSLQETLLMLAAAIMLDRWIGDPKWPTHPVIWMGRLIHWLEKALRRDEHQAISVSKRSESAGDGESRDTGLRGNDSGKEGRRNTVSQNGLSSSSLRLRGAVLAILTVGSAAAILYGIVWGAVMIHPWLGYAVNTWFIATTIAIKGLKDAAILVYKPLTEGHLQDARTYVGYIVGRDTASLEESEITRAAVETVAENTVDAVVSPLFFALLGGAPLAMAYRAANTLDSMVGYKNERYLHFGWFSARLDDVLNWIPARLTGLLLVVSSLSIRGMSAKRAWLSILHFARLHPSPNSGIPEAAAAGAMGVRLGGVNRYGDTVSERAGMGWPLQSLNREHIIATVRLLLRTSDFIVGGVVCAWIAIIIG